MKGDLVKGRYYFHITCSKCGTDVAFMEAPSPEDEPQPKSRAVQIVCPRCQEARTYSPHEIRRGIYEGE
jgi:uncharacterized protein (DUF983 family)